MTGTDLMRKMDQRICVVDNCWNPTGPTPGGKPLTSFDVDEKTGMPHQMCPDHRANPPKRVDPNRATAASRRLHQQDGLDNLDRLLR